MSSLHNILNDFQVCFKNSHIWSILSFNDIRTRYRRTVIGPLWLTLGTAVTILGMGFVWSSIFGINVNEFLPYVAVGIVMWVYISAILNESCSVFTSQVSIIHNVKTSYFIHIMTMISRNLIILAHNMVVIIAVFLACGQGISLEILWFLPGMALLLLNSFWIGISLGVFATRYRDLTSIVVSLTTLIMFVTPIMWKVDMLQGNRRAIALLNPFAHMISVMRDPLLGQAPSGESYAILGGICVVGFSFSLWVYKKYIHRVVFWM